MKNKPPHVERSPVSDRLVGANRLFERDVLMQDEPRREPRVRSSIIGDKKLKRLPKITHFFLCIYFFKTKTKQKITKIPKMAALYLLK